MNTETTKKCPQCGNTDLVPMRTILHTDGTLGVKHCSDCNINIPWKLDKGQKTLM